MHILCAALFALLTPQVGPGADAVDLGGGSIGAAGFPRLAYVGSPIVGRPFALRVENGPPGAGAWVGASLADAPVSLPAFGATLHPLAPFVVLEALVLDGNGSAPTSIALPSIVPALAGLTFTVQALVADASALGSIAFTDALRITIGEDDGWPLLPRPLIAARDLPEYLVAAHMDGDGHLDLVARNRTNGSVSVALGQGRGRFAPEIVHDATGFFGVVFQAGLAVGDVDGDGSNDVVAGRLFPMGLDLLFGVGDGTLAAAVHPPVPGDAPRGVALADVDGDGDEDLLVRDLASLWLMRSRGDRTFDAAVELHRVDSGSGISALASGDVDGDGDVDLALGTSTGPVVLSNYGPGVFDVEFELPGYGAATALAFGDIDRDGNLDLVHAGGGLIRLLRGDGAACFFDSGDEIPVQDPASLQVGDMDGDGELDVLVASLTAPASVYRGDGQGSLDHTQLVIGATIARLPGLGDVDGDGSLDVLTAMGRYVVQHLSQQGHVLDLSSADAAAASGAITPSRVRVADLDRDGHLDVLVVIAGGSELAAFLGRGDGTLASPVATSVGSFVDDVLLADDDGDGVLDAHVVGTSPKRLAIARGLGDGRFAPVVDLLSGQQLAGLARGDLDGDGRADLLVGRPESQSLSRFDGLAQGGFAAPVSLPVGVRPSWLHLAPIDGDGHLDLVLHSNPDGVLTVALGVGDGTFVPAWQLALGPSSFAPTVHDVDGDGVLDLVLHGALASAAAIHLGQGDGTFVAAGSIAVQAPLATHFADVDGDGLADALVTSSAYLFGGFVEEVLHVHRALGNGAFGELSRFAVAHPLALGDFDENGLTDVAGRSATSHDLVVLLNELLR